MQCGIVVTDVVSNPSVIHAVRRICVVPIVIYAFSDDGLGIILTLPDNRARSFVRIEYATVLGRSIQHRRLCKAM